ncbi:hypothetical protein [Deinococcus budaensis]|uniref:Uncharacterized protein n=1 Tax=Deinococcus budaensis TaxID=1665626 RepID=A0A7W8GI22_9DEIO|nr:hypothetical protein [Deinococcus budaensis]MBB5235673.1 hypothetical protein [Deinococcus budaensis]
MLRNPLLALGLLALASCGNTPLPDATLRLSPGSVTLKPGQSTNVTVYFKKYLYEGDPKDYFLSVSPDTDRGVRVTTFGPSLGADDSTFFRVEAASNAEPGRHTFLVVVHDNKQHSVNQTLTVNVSP